MVAALPVLSPSCPSPSFTPRSILGGFHGRRFLEHAGDSLFPFPLKTLDLSSGHQKINFAEGRLPSAGAGKPRAKPNDIVARNTSTSAEKGMYSYDVETLINKLSSLPPRGSIARCLEGFRNKLSPNDFVLVFKEFAERRDWQRLLRLFKYLQRQAWCRPNEHIYTIVISVLGREGLVDRCLELFEEMPQNGIIRSVFAFTALINAYGRNGKYETTLELLDRMKAEKVAPNILTYNTVINSCVRGGLNWDELLGLFAEMRHEGIQPDLVTYNTLLSACVNRGLGDEAEMVFRTMNDGGVLPDTTSYRHLVDTFMKLGNLDRVSGLLREMEARGSLPDVASYNVLLDAYARSGFARDAMGVFRQMQSAGCMPNAATYSILLNLYGKHGRYDDVRELFLEMKLTNTEPNSATYNILIQVFGEGGYFKEIITLFDDMVEGNVAPNMETFEGLIRVCGKGGLYEDAQRILLYMSEKGAVPSSKVYSGVIDAYGQAALYDQALVVFNTMEGAGCPPTIETYNSLISMFAKGGLCKESNEVLLKMGKSGVPRNRHSFNGLIEGFRQGGQFEEAMNSYVEMQKASCDPDEQSFELMLSVYCSAGLVGEAEGQFQEMKSLGMLPCVICDCMMLGLYAKRDRWDEAHEILSRMVDNSSSDIHKVAGMMIKGDCDDGNNWQMVEYVFDKLISKGCSFGARFYNSLLEVLWWLGQRQRGARVLAEAQKRGLFPELFRRNKLVWSVDVHRMWEGAAYVALSVWVNGMYEMFVKGEDVPSLATAVVARGEMERKASTCGLPVAQAAHEYLKENVSPWFGFAGWNRGRVVCQRPQLRKLLAGLRAFGVPPIVLADSPFPLAMSGKATKASHWGKTELVGGKV